MRDQKGKFKKDEEGATIRMNPESLSVPTVVFPPEEIITIDEEGVVSSPLNPYQALVDAQAGRDESDIPMSDNYWKIRKKLQGKVEGET